MSVPLWQCMIITIISSIVLLFNEMEQKIGFLISKWCEDFEKEKELRLVKDSMR